MVVGRDSFVVAVRFASWRGSDDSMGTTSGGGFPFCYDAA